MSRFELTDEERWLYMPKWEKAFYYVFILGYMLFGMVQF